MTGQDEKDWTGLAGLDKTGHDKTKFDKNELDLTTMNNFEQN